MQMMSWEVGVDSEVVFKRQNDSPDLREWSRGMVFIVKLHRNDTNYSKKKIKRPFPGKRIVDTSPLFRFEGFKVEP